MDDIYSSGVVVKRGASCAVANRAAGVVVVVNRDPSGVVPYLSRRAVVLNRAGSAVAVRVMSRVGGATPLVTAQELALIAATVPLTGSRVEVVPETVDSACMVP
jgi:hypothetical protein